MQNQPNTATTPPINQQSSTNQTNGQSLNQPTNQKNTTKIKLAWYHYLIILAAVVLIISSIIRVLTPTPTITNPNLSQSNYDNTTSIFSGARFVGQPIAIPKELGAYSLTQNKTQDSLLQQIITKYNLKQNPDYPQYWNGQKYSLFHDEERNRFLLSKNQDPNSVFVQNQNSNETQITPINTERATQEAISFLETNFSLQNLEANGDNIIFGQATTQFYEIEEKDADLAIIPISYKLEGFPVLLNKSSNHPFEVTIDSKMEIFKVELAAFYPTFEKIGRGSTISIESAVQAINSNSGRASLVYAQSDTIDFFSTERFSSIILNKVRLEYRTDSTSETVLPFYRFVGVGRDKNNKSVELEIITPAILTNR
jgi:hypothetical protein